MQKRILKYYLIIYILKFNWEVEHFLILRLKTHEVT